MSEFQPFWNLASDANLPDVLNMYVYGRITSSSHWLFGSDDDVVTSEFIKDLKAFPEAKRINVYINSPGGDVFAAAAIKNQLKSHPAEVHAFIDGLAASAAVGLSMGANVVHMSRSALVMVHNPSTRAEGEVKDFAKQIEVLQKVKATIISIYQEKTQLTEERLGQLMDEETWLTADEALELGFIDAIVEDAGLDVKNALNNRLMVNGVAFDFNDSYAFETDGYTFCNNLSKAKLEAKLSEVINKQGGKDVMDYEQIMNSMSEEQQTVLNSHVAGLIASAEAAKEAAWTEEKSTMEAEIVDLKSQLEAAAAATNVVGQAQESIVDTLPEEVRNMLVEAQEKAVQAEQKLAVIEKEKAIMAFKEKMAVYASLPMTDENITALYELSAANATHFAQVEALLKVANAAMEAGFTSTGVDGVPTASSALEELNNKISALRVEHPDLDYNTALKQIANTDPNLYQKYRSEQQ